VRALGTTALLAVAEPVALPLARAIFIFGLRAFDLACSRFREDSQLAEVNRAGGRAVAVGDLLWDALGAALRAADYTDGLVDPTVGRSLRLAGYDRTFLRVLHRDGRLVEPTFEVAARWREIELDWGQQAVRVPAGVELDLGATAKALAADRIAVAAAGLAGCGVLVSLGGDIAVAGAPPAGGWAIRIADDHAVPVDTPGPTVALAGGGLATSSTVVRRWASAAGELHHIVDPRTGRPADSPWRTVTVAAASCFDANAASTAAVVLGDAAPSWLEARRLSARLVRNDGSVSRMGAWPAEEAEAA
jgi:thiamine biosynthesis lipoprotein